MIGIFYAFQAKIEAMAHRARINAVAYACEYIHLKSCIQYLILRSNAAFFGTCDYRKVLWNQ